MPNKEEAKVQKALGTLRKFEVSIDMSYVIHFGATEIVEAINEEHAKDRMKQYLATDESKKEVIFRLIADICNEDPFDFIEDIVDQMQGNAAIKLCFDTLEVDPVIDIDNNVDATIPYIE